MALAILAMSLGLLVSGVGLVSLGHAAFFGLGAYVLALVVAGRCRRRDLVGAARWSSSRRRWPLRRSARWRCARSGVYFIMLTLAFGQMLFYLFHDAQIRRRLGRALSEFPAERRALRQRAARRSTTGRRCSMSRWRSWSWSMWPSACCCARRSGGSSSASASTSTACGRWATTPIATSWWRSPSPARSRPLPASSTRRNSAP